MRSPSRSAARAASAPRARSRAASRERGWPERARSGGCSRSVSFVEDDVVDQARLAEAHRGGEDWRVKRGDGDVVDVEPVEEAGGFVRVLRRERAREGER